MDRLSIEKKIFCVWRIFLEKRVFIRVLTPFLTLSRRSVQDDKRVTEFVVEGPLSQQTPKSGSIVTNEFSNSDAGTGIPRDFGPNPCIRVCTLGPRCMYTLGPPTSFVEGFTKWTLGLFFVDMFP